MKTLILVRHAKSSRDDPTVSDKDRPLNERGLRDASRAGERLARRGVKPDIILSSSARRAHTTAEIFARKLGYGLEDLVADEGLYAATPDHLLAVISGLDDRVECVMVFGHNPEMTELASRLSGRITEMPTCAIAEFEFAIKSWSSVGEQKPQRATLHRPKES
jgi:phosphohistidine phosphatase